MILPSDTNLKDINTVTNHLTVAEVARLSKMFPGCRFLTFTKSSSIKTILEGVLGYHMKSKLLPKRIIRAVEKGGMTQAILDGATWEVLYQRKG